MAQKSNGNRIDYAEYDSAVGLNWYLTDPNLRALMDRYIPAGDREWAEGILVRWGELCGGPIASRAEASTATRRGSSATTPGATKRLPSSTTRTPSRRRKTSGKRARTASRPAPGGGCPPSSAPPSPTCSASPTPAWSAPPA